MDRAFLLAVKAMALLLPPSLSARVLSLPGSNRLARLAPRATRQSYKALVGLSLRAGAKPMEVPNSRVKASRSKQTQGRVRAPGCTDSHFQLALRAVIGIRDVDAF
jgi:hypothetical protein